MLPDPDLDFFAWMRAVDDDWIATDEAAGLLGVTPGRLCYLRRRGRTPPNISAKLSRRWIVWAVDGVTAWAARRARGISQ